MPADSALRAPRQWSTKCAPDVWPLGVERRLDLLSMRRRSAECLDPRFRLRQFTTQLPLQVMQLSSNSVKTITRVSFHRPPGQAFVFSRSNNQRTHPSGACRLRSARTVIWSSSSPSLASIGQAPLPLPPARRVRAQSPRRPRDARSSSASTPLNNSPSSNFARCLATLRRCTFNVRANASMDENNRCCKWQMIRRDARFAGSLASRASWYWLKSRNNSSSGSLA
jgi:hypothetical protein